MREISKDKFSIFLEELKRRFPEGALFVGYQETNGKILILGVGSNSKCAEQTAQALRKYPERRKRRLRLKLVRPPEIGFLIR